MFDWFRKKKKKDQDPEAPVLEDQTLVEAEDEAEPESEAAPEEPVTDPEPAPAAEEPPQPEEEPALDPPAVEDRPETIEEELPPADEPPVAKKGFFARFREKFSASEAAEPEAPADEVEALEQADESEAEPGEELTEDLPELPAAQDSPMEDDTPDLEPAAEPAPAAPEISPPVSPEPEAEDETAPEDVSPDEPAEALAEIEEEEPEAEAELEATDEEAEEGEDDDDDEAPRQGLFARFKDKLSATRNRLAGRIETLLSSVRAIDDDLLDELEELLITADLGAQTTDDLLFKIRGQVAKKELNDAEALKEALKKRIREMVELPVPPRPQASPMVIMVVGINGVGKTTTIAKLARRLKEDEGQKVLLAAGDTFRSAAVEQLGIWAERLGVDIVSQPTGADASAVVFDALTAAQARKADVVIIDTAGRLHTKVNLMDELKKIKRVAGKAMPGAPHHTILVLDGNTGQNAMRQAQTFHEAVGVDSIVVTKLDGTAKGGVIVSITNELKIPIAFVGLGESFEDLQPFDAQAFTEAIIEP